MCEKEKYPHYVRWHKMVRGFVDNNIAKKKKKCFIIVQFGRKVVEEKTVYGSMVRKFIMGLKSTRSISLSYVYIYVNDQRCKNTILGYTQSLIYSFWGRGHWSSWGHRVHIQEKFKYIFDFENRVVAYKFLNGFFYEIRQ